MIRSKIETHIENMKETAIGRDSSLLIRYLDKIYQECLEKPECKKETAYLLTMLGTTGVAKDEYWQLISFYAYKLDNNLTIPDFKNNLIVDDLREGYPPIMTEANKKVSGAIACDPEGLKFNIKISKAHFIKKNMKNLKKQW